MSNHGVDYTRNVLIMQFDDLPIGALFQFYSKDELSKENELESAIYMKAKTADSIYGVRLRDGFGAVYKKEAKVKMIPEGSVIKLDVRNV